MTGKTRVGGFMEWAIVCDVCGKTRAHGNHKKCSKIRQAERQKERDQAKS